MVNELTARLVAIGLTEYEAKVYLALLAEHPVTGYQISKASGVPRSMVYEALGRLEARGAVLKSVEEKATLYEPIAPTALLDRYEREARERATELRTRLTPMYTMEKSGRIWNFSGRREALLAAENLIESAQHELMLVLTDADVSALRTGLAAAHARGVELGIMLTGDADVTFGQVVRHPKRETELHGMVESLIVVADEAQVLIASGHTVSEATVTTNRNMVMIARQFIWMELFAQRIFARLGEDLLARLDPDDRQVLHS